MALRNFQVFKIQWNWKRKQLANALPKIDNSRIISKNLSLIRLNILKPKIVSEAKKIIGKAFEISFIPWKSKVHMLQYMLNIRNMQWRLIKHMSVKNLAREELKNKWQKAVSRLVDNQDEYEEMGLEYDMDRLLNVYDYIKQGMFDHIIDRQMLRWVQLRYDYLVVISDKNLKDKIEMLVTDPEEEQQPTEDPKVTVNGPTASVRRDSRKQSFVSRKSILEVFVNPNTPSESQ